MGGRGTIARRPPVDRRANTNEPKKERVRSGEVRATVAKQAAASERRIQAVAEIRNEQGKMLSSVEAHGDHHAGLTAVP